ncbi:glutathione peroxidase [Rhodococcus sp. NCIMB 12038]|uniref:glutathione peroxidase n=1 Tax=Rhodococcus sp. NCIMB 12038 TaxID=933800 RepID=UPI000B3C1FF2|nr:glutathione peroxidase [Rhodococcus sp. NCIMB 12038]OUS83986.1 glutathione peroxidase [Rhodococcus sp. NCIMB 12038]
MNVHDYSVRTAEGTIENLSAYRGKLLLIVNVASKCGLTPQYEGLEILNREYSGRGLQIVGFPCNQFGGQEPGTDAAIQDFCRTIFDVKFPVYAKIDVNGDNADPLYEHLRSQAPGDFAPDGGFLYEHVSKTRPESIGTDEVKWNFTKFLVDRDGGVIRRFEPMVTPEEVGREIGALL